MEGKDYIMQDGDVVEFRFNVYPKKTTPARPAVRGGGGGLRPINPRAPQQAAVGFKPY